MLMRDGLPWSIALVWTLLGIAGTQCSWTVRPNIFTILFVLIAARVLERFSAGVLPRTRTWWLVPLFAVWANIHGGFIAGFILLGVGTMCEAARAIGGLSRDERASARSRAVHLAVLTGACGIATLANPYGIGLYRWVFLLLGEDYYMTLHLEWKSPDFRAAGGMRFEILMLLFPFLLGVSVRRPGLMELGLAVLLAAPGPDGFPLRRLVGSGGCTADGPLEHCDSLSPRVGSPLAAERARELFRQAGQSQCLAVVVCLHGRAVHRGGSGERGSGASRSAHHRDQALDRLLTMHREWKKQHGHAPVLFHSYDWGGYLTWHGWPEVLNWIDDRNEVQGKQHIQHHFALRDAEPGWEREIEPFDLVCIETDAALTYRLAEMPHRWHERYRDDYAVIFERVGR